MIAFPLPEQTEQVLKAPEVDSLGPGGRNKPGE